MRNFFIHLLTSCITITALANTARANDTDHQPTSTDSAHHLDQIWSDGVKPYATARSLLLKKIEKTVKSGPYSGDWRSLSKYHLPAWYGAAKFGIFIHWGVFSVPAYNSEWYPRRMYQVGTKEYEHHLKTYGSVEKFGYKDFIPLFRAVNYNPDAWVSLFRDAGARYIVPVAEHHDGFALYDSHLSDWTSVKMGPHRDLIGDLEAAACKQGLYFGLSSHLGEHDWFFDEGRNIRSDVNDPHYASLYGPAQPRLMKSKDDINVGADYTAISRNWMDEWLTRSAELVDLYHPDLIYFDWWIAKSEFRGQLPRFASYYYDTMSRLHPGNPGVINYKDGAFPDGSAALDIERGVLDQIAKQPWQTCTSISRKAWGYIEGDDYKSAPELLRVLVDVVSKNGNLLLNVGPKADGTIPAPAENTLRAIGAWLKINGAAIYDTHPWRVFAEGPTRAASGSFSESKSVHFTSEDFRFTQHGQTVFAIAMGHLSSSHILLKSFDSTDSVKHVRLLGGADIAFTRDAHGLHLHPNAPLPELPVFSIEG